MKAEIVSIGHELLMGELTDLNASWIASRLPALGIQLRWVSIIGDDLEMLADAFTAACNAPTSSSPPAASAPPPTT